MATISQPWQYLLIKANGKAKVGKPPKQLREGDRIFRFALGDVQEYVVKGRVRRMG